MKGLIKPPKLLELKLRFKNVSNLISYNTNQRAYKPMRKVTQRLN